MKVTYAAFHITHRKKSYSVQYEVSAITQNVSQVITTVQDAEGNILGSVSNSGRQIISPWNAKQALTDVLTERGIYKPHKKEEPEPGQPQTPQTEEKPDLPDLSELENI